MKTLLSALLLVLLFHGRAEAGTCLQHSHEVAMESRCAQAMASGLYSQVKVSPTCGILGAKWVQIANQGMCGCCVLKKEAAVGASNNGGGILGVNLPATPIKPATRAALAARRNAVRGWAPICSNGALGLNQPPECAQGDMLEYSGMSCLMGEAARCDDVKRSQSADGRFWRNPTTAKTQVEPGDGKNSFSRDMLMGVFDYLIRSNDKAAMERFLAYLHAHKNRMCPDATDNRCRLVPSTWGLVGFVAKKIGVPVNSWVKLAEKTVDVDVFLASETAPKGYMMELIAHHIMLRRALGQNTAAMKSAAKRLAGRQPLNPLFRTLDEGPTEEAAALALEICPAQKGKLAHDIFFQRELERDASGAIVVLRDWHEPVPPKASDVASGHDCMIVLDALLQ
jgi:hypothetical protein